MSPSVHKKPCCWIVVGDAQSAKVYEAWAPDYALALRQTLHAPRLRDFQKSRDGRLRAETNPTRRAAEPRLPIREELAFYFALNIADYIYAAQQKRCFKELVLVLPPRMLSKVKAILAKPVRKIVIGEIPKDYMRCTQAELSARLKEFM